MITPQTIQAITQHAIKAYPNECCGVIIQVSGKNCEEYYPCNSLAKKPKSQFVMDPKDYAAAEDYGTILAIVHSHPDYPARPSIADKVVCEESGLPWYIQAVTKDENTGEIVPGELFRFEPTGYKAPLLERPFYHGILDCYSLINDFFSRELNIQLPDFEREDNWWADPNAAELYLENYSKAGFYKLPKETPPQYGDVFLMQFHSKKVNHGGIYLGETPLKESPNLARVPNAFLHHRYGHFSERSVYGGYWSDITRVIVRHERMPK